jgi:hypothetical protein
MVRTLTNGTVNKAEFLPALTAGGDCAPQFLRHDLCAVTRVATLRSDTRCEKKIKKYASELDP